MKTIQTAIFASICSLFYSSGFSNTFTLVSLSSDPVEILSSGIIESYSLPQINEAGQVGFSVLLGGSTIEDATLFDAILQFDNGQLSLLASSHESVSIGGESVDFEGFRDLDIMSDSSVAFIGKVDRSSNLPLLEYVLSGSLRGDPPLPSFEFHASSSGSPVIDFEGGLDPVRRHQIFASPKSADATAFSFLSRLQSGDNPDQTGIWIAERPALETDPLPTLKLAALGRMATKGGSLTVDRPVALSLNASLEGALLATTEDSDENDFNNPQAIWALDSNVDSTLVAKTGDLAPDSSANFAAFGKPAIDGNADIYFWANLVDDQDEEGLFQYSGGSLSSIAISSLPIEVFGTDRNFTGFLDPVVSPAGDLAVLATEAENNLQTLLLRSSDGTWSIIAQTGMQAPGANAGAVYDMLSLPRINGAGQIAFQATLTGSGDAISDTTNSGVWATDLNGAVSLVAREGDTIDVKPGFPATIDVATIGGFNSSGELALRYAFTNGAKAIGIVRVEEVGPPAISSQPSGMTSYDGESFTLTVEASGQGPFEYQWSKDGEPIVGAVSSSLEIENASTADDGDYQVTVFSPSGSTTSSVASISIQSLPNQPVFVSQPLGDIALRGTEAVLDARAVSNTTVTYQWYLNDEPISAETSSVLRINPADYDDEGTYHVVATSGGGSATSASAEILVTDKRLFNIAARARVGTGANVLITGFVVIGPDPKEVLIRGIGPSLANDGIEDPLLQPRLELYNSANELIYSNDAWGDNPDPDAILSASQVVGAGQRSLDANDTAMLVELEQGLYTAIVRGQDDTTGVALLEAFEVEQNLTRMLNISARALVGTGTEVVIPGFVVQGDIPSRVLIRAVGPTLANKGVAGILAHPQIRVHDINGTPIAYNDGWQNLWNPDEVAEASALVGAFPLDEGSDDAALILDLEPGLYTVVTTGENLTTGVALVEVYSIP